MPAHTSLSIPVNDGTSAAAFHDRLLDFDGASLPVELEEALHKLYANVHSSTAHLRIYGGMESVRLIYVGRDSAGRVTSLFLLQEEGRRIRVINEGMRLDAATVEAFSRHMFAARPMLSAIEFNGIDVAPLAIAFPIQQVISTAEMPLALPDSIDDYLAGLGKNMRRNLRRYMDKLCQQHPGFHFDVLEGDDIPSEHARAVIALNRTRITAKQQTFSINDEEGRILALLRECGMAGIGWIDGKICCGALGYRIGDRYFFKIIGHDPQYNQYSLGILCCYLMISACIQRGCSEYNFMWNEYEYKYALGAHRRDLHRVVIYRSRMHQLRQGGLAAALALAGARYRAAALLEPNVRMETLSPAARMAAHLLRGARALKRSLAALRTAQT